MRVSACHIRSVSAYRTLNHRLRARMCPAAAGPYCAGRRKGLELVRIRVPGNGFCWHARVHHCGVLIGSQSSVRWTGAAPLTQGMPAYAAGNAVHAPALIPPGCAASRPKPSGLAGGTGAPLERQQIGHRCGHRIRFPSQVLKEQSRNPGAGREESGTRLPTFTQPVARPWKNPQSTAALQH